MCEEHSSFPVRNNGAPDLLRLLDDGPNLPIAAALKVELHLLGEWLADPVSLFLTLPHPHPLPLPLPHRSILVGLLPQRQLLWSSDLLKILSKMGISLLSRSVYLCHPVNIVILSIL